MPSEMSRYPSHAPRCLCDLSKIATRPMVEPRYHIKIIKNKYHQSCAGKRYWPHMRVRRLSRGGPGGHCWYPTDRVPLCKRLKRSAPRLQTRSRCQRALALPRAPRHRACHLPGEGFGVATCPMAQSAPPARKGLRCRHVPRGTERATCQERAPVSPHGPRHRASRLLAHPL
jgi:hypothetical protein